jgi:hypothetical protein
MFKNRAREKKGDSVEYIIEEELNNVNILRATFGIGTRNKY